MSNYNETIKKDNEVFTVQEFKIRCRDKLFIDYDGHGYAAKNGKMNGKIIIKPSRISEIPPDATHVVWFNR